MPRGKLSAVPDRPDPDVYGHIDYFDGRTTHRLTIGVRNGGEHLDDNTEDVVLSWSGKVIRHPFGAGRDSTEEERAAVGWTW